MPSSNGTLGADDLEEEEEELISELIEDEDIYGESLPELGNQGHYVVTAHGVRRRVRMHSLDATPIFLGEQQQRLSTSMGAVCKIYLALTY